MDVVEDYDTYHAICFWANNYMPLSSCRFIHLKHFLSAWGVYPSRTLLLNHVVLSTQNLQTLKAKESMARCNEKINDRWASSRDHNTAILFDTNL